MKNTLLASVAFLVLGATATFATVPALDLDAAVSSAQQPNFLVLADSDGDSDGGSDGGSDGDHSGGGNSGGGDSDDNDSDDNDSDDDSGDDNSDDDANDDSDDNSRNGDSGRRRARVPGGSGCDDAGDIAEHAECRAQ
jgi:hypothetical protein